MADNFVDKPFKSVKEQINILKVRNLLFHDEESASKSLHRYGYYEIINGYKDNFMIDPTNDDKGFKPNISFDHIYQLFVVDQNLRATTVEALEYFEANLRQVVAYVVAKYISYNQFVYIDRKKYNHGPRYKHIHGVAYPVDKLMNTLDKITRRNDQPFKHYREDHGNIPPWIIVKRLSLGNLIWWTRLLKGPQKSQVISRMMGLPIEIVQGNTELNEIFGDYLSLILDYRNIAAHGGRIYNHYSSRHNLKYRGDLYSRYFKVTREEYNQGKGQSRLGTLLNGLDIFENKEPYFILKNGIIKVLTQYSSLYPEDNEYLLNSMELNDNFLD